MYREWFIGWTDRDWMRRKGASMQQTVTDRNSNGVGNGTGHATGRMRDALIVIELKYTLRKMHTHIKEKSRETEKRTHIFDNRSSRYICRVLRNCLVFNLIHFRVLNSVFHLANSTVPWALQLYEEGKNCFCFSASQRKVCLCVGVSVSVCVCVCERVRNLLKSRWKWQAAFVCL